MSSDPERTALHLVSGRLLARGTVLNLLGQGAPVLVALVAIPLLVSRLGTDRFGVLTLAWLVVGYFSLFDLGLGRALTQLVAQRLGTADRGSLAALVWTALAIMAVVAAVGAGLVFVLAPLLVERVLRIPVTLQRETIIAFRLLALAIPLVTSAAGLAGVLAAHQRFGMLNAARVPLGALIFLAPVLVLPFSRSLVAIVGALVVTRVLGWVVHLLLCLHVMPELRRGPWFDRAAVGPLLRFGGWMTVSNVVSPIMVYVDRFLIGALVSITFVAYYATPYEVVTKLLLVSVALVTVLFPAFASTFAHSPELAAKLYYRGLKFSLLALFPLTLIVVVLARPGLHLWVGADFAAHGARVMQWLVVGVLLNGLAQVPFALVQGLGRPDVTSKLHLMELPLYLPVAWWLITRYGIDGAAWAWVLRVSVDTVVLLALADRLLPQSHALVRQLALPGGLTLAVLAGAFHVHGVAASLGFLLVTLAGFAVGAWRLLLDDEERAFVRRLRRRTG